ILAQFKEPRAADSMAARLADHWDSDAANKALTDMGPIAESAVLKYMNDKDARARDRARALLQGYGTKPEKLFGQTLMDLESADAGRRGAAVQWLAKQPVDEKRKAEVSEALNKSLETMDALRNNDLVSVMENWGTPKNVPALTNILEKST